MEYQSWLPIPDWPEYKISDDGLVVRVKSACGATVGAVLKWTFLPNGYAKVALCRDSVRKEYLVHRLVAMTYLGPIPANMDVCHFNGVKHDNRIANLRIATRAENVADNVRLDRHNRGERCGANKHSETTIRDAKSRMLAGYSVPALSAELGIPRSTLYGLRAGRIWRWL